jgi:hypothetical protein
LKRHPPSRGTTRRPISIRRNSSLRSGGKNQWKAGVGRRFAPVCYRRPRRPGIDERRSCFKGLTAPSDPRGPERLFFGYRGVQRSFERPWPVRRPRQAEPRSQQASQSTDRIARNTVNVAICRTFGRSILRSVSTADGPLPTAVSSTDRGSHTCESDVLQVFLLPQPRRGRCGRWFSRALLMTCDLCRWIAPIRNAPTRSLAPRTPPRPYQLRRQGRSASSTQAIQSRLP